MIVCETGPPIAAAAAMTQMARLVRRYDDLPLGTTDASVIAAAERFGAPARGARVTPAVRK